MPLRRKRGAGQVTWIVGIALVSSLGLAGCGNGAAPPAGRQAADAPVSTTPPQSSGRPQRRSPSDPPSQVPADDGQGFEQPIFWPRDDPGDGNADNDETAATANDRPAASPVKRAIDPEKLAAVGIRRIDGERLTLYTDLPANAEIDSLCQAFDQCYAQWRQYFGLDVEPAVPWRATGYLMRDVERFKAAGLWDAALPSFQNGYSLGHEFWLYDQPSAYYRRHLLLHEGTHCLMHTRLPAQPTPAWHFEGLAELFGTHAWRDGQLTARYFPRDRQEVPLWGRIKIVKEAYERREALPLTEVLNAGPRAHLDNEPYGWCWSLSAFLDGHPRYRERFRALACVPGSEFPARFRAAYEPDWDDLQEEWQVFIGGIEYGYDLERTAIDFAAGQPLPDAGGEAAIAADRGWQPSGYRLEAGQSYELTALGRYQVDDEPEVWWCEPNGVSIRYYDEAPLGILRAAVRPDRHDPAALSALLQPDNVGLSYRLTPTESGTLYLRINDSGAELSDNAGTLTVRIEAVE